jgi:hypothetical protein
MAHRLQATNKVRHKILIYSSSHLSRPMLQPPGNYSGFESWSIAMAAFYGEDSITASSYEILEKNKHCRVINPKYLSDNDWSFLYFIVDVKSLTVEQAIATTKIGCVILTHNS